MDGTRLIQGDVFTAANGVPDNISAVTSGYIKEGCAVFTIEVLTGTLELGTVDHINGAPTTGSMPRMSVGDTRQFRNSANNRAKLYLSGYGGDATFYLWQEGPDKI